MTQLPLLLSPGNFVAPLLIAALLAGGLWLIHRLLDRYGSLRGLSIPYALGAIALSISVLVALGAAAAGVAIDARLQHALLAVLIFAWGFVALGLLENLLLERWMKRGGMSVPRLVRDIGRATALLVAVLATIQFVLEIPLTSIVISSTIISAVVGLALQDLLKNLIAGVALQIERPFEVGHWLKVGDDTGQVVEMSWRATRVLTVDGNYVIYPNATLAQAELVNFSLPTPLQAMHTQIALSHAHPPNLVKRTLVRAMAELPDVAASPAPSVKVLAYGEDDVTYDLKFWLHTYDRYPEKRDAVMTAAWYAIRRAGLELPLRQVQIHQAVAERETSQRRETERVAAELRRAELLSALNDEEIRDLAERVSVHLYATGETVVRQGEQGDMFCLLRSGQVRVDVDDGRGVLTVNRLGPGDVFGELALLTGAPRGATIVVEQDVELLEVEREDLAPLLRANPSLAERLGALLEQRARMNAEVLASREVPVAGGEDMSRRSLAGRIRQLFGLTARPAAERDV